MGAELGLSPRSSEVGTGSGRIGGEVMRALAFLLLACGCAAQPVAQSADGQWHQVEPENAQKAEDRRDGLLDRASFDLQCPRTEIQITEIDQRSSGATGCDKRAVYQATCATHRWGPNCTWTLNSESHPASAKSAVAGSEAK
jgi:hypothetical protein